MRRPGGEPREDGGCWRVRRRGAREMILTVCMRTSRRHLACRGSRAPDSPSLTPLLSQLMVGIAIGLMVCGLSASSALESPSAHRTSVPLARFAASSWGVGRTPAHISRTPQASRHPLSVATRREMRLTWPNAICPYANSPRSRLVMQMEFECGVSDLSYLAANGTSSASTARAALRAKVDESHRPVLIKDAAGRWPCSSHASNGQSACGRRSTPCRPHSGRTNAPRPRAGAG
jgi:hypothetical protein